MAVQALSKGCHVDPSSGKPCHVDEKNECVLDDSTDHALEINTGNDGSTLPTDATSENLNTPPRQLDWVSRLLTLWVALAMAFGTLLSHYAPGVREALTKAEVGDTNLVIAIGLILMLIPPLAKAHYGNILSLDYYVEYRWELLISVAQNWLIGPALMFLLAWGFLHNEPGLMHGIVMVGLARCIAMVVQWNELAYGDTNLCVVMVAMNSILQVLLFAPMALFYVVFLGDAVGAPADGLSGSQAVVTVVTSVLIYLGIPMVIGVCSWVGLRRWKGESWYYEVFIPRLDPLGLIALLVTIVFIFIIKGEQLIDRPLDVLLAAVPLVFYFLIMFFGSLTVAFFMGFCYERAATLAFTAASNNFELAIAISIATFGSESDASFATVMGPLIEVPIMLIFVQIALLLRKRWDAKLKRRM
eukprot:comp7410_c0_seq1/m.3089 comp7410_c0_seq1/g.3089  ORF comp7410_c0_seq1/g.3089 comp7410_c0_seq1/m.3089 type:complete len:415 (-) comp7410_c0_seq1:102-1346(-)